MVVGLVIASWSAPPALAQEQAATRSEALDARSAFAFWLGGESVPAGVDRTCWETGRSALGLVGASFIVPLGTIALEGRVGAHWRSESICAAIGPLIQSGIHTQQIPELPVGSFASLDIRARWTPFPNHPWYVAAGAGWAGSSKDVPYLSTSLGARSASRSPRFGTDLELALYRVPWTERTIDATDDGVTEIARREYKEWAPTVGIRFSIEIPLGYEPPRTDP